MDNFKIVCKLTPADSGYTIKPLSDAPEGGWYVIYNATTSDFIDEVPAANLASFVGALTVPAVAVAEDGPSGIAYA